MWQSSTSRSSFPLSTSALIRRPWCPAALLKPDPVARVNGANRLGSGHPFHLPLIGPAQVQYLRPLSSTCKWVITQKDLCYKRIRWKRSLENEESRAALR